MRNGSPCPRPKCIPWPENELAAHVTHDLHRKRPVTLYNDRSLPKSACAHSMTSNPSLLSCMIEIDNKTLYWFPCLHTGWLFKTAHVHVWILTTVTTGSAAGGRGWVRWGASLLLTFASLDEFSVCDFQRVLRMRMKGNKRPQCSDDFFCFTEVLNRRQLRCFLFVSLSSDHRAVVHFFNSDAEIMNVKCWFTHETHFQIRRRLRIYSKWVCLF